MRKLKYKGKTTYLEEEDWRGMLKRWKEAVKVGVGIRVAMKCPLCAKYERECELCELNVFADDGGYGCVDLVSMYLAEGGLNVRQLCYGSVSIKIESVEGLDAAEAIYKGLKALPRVPFWKLWWWYLLGGCGFSNPLLKGSKYEKSNF